MNNIEVKKAFQQIAEKEGVSIEIIRSEIALAISEARKNPDPKIRAFWESIPYKGDKLEPEDVVLHIAKIVNDKKNNPS